VWLKDAEGAVAAYEAGVIKGIWKVAGTPEIVTILESNLPTSSHRRC